MGEPSSSPGTEVHATVITGLALAFSSSVLLALPFLIAHVWAVQYIALVPWALLLARPRGRQAWLYVTAGMLAFLAIAAASLSAYHWSTPLILALVCSPFLVLFPVVVRLGHQRLGLPFLVLLPVAWVAVEWARSRFATGGVGLFLIGTAHFPVRDVIQIAGLTGVAGVSFVVAAGSGAVADLLVHWRRRRPTGLLSVATFVLLLASVLAYGRAQIERTEPAPGPRVALVQPNARQNRDSATALRRFEEQLGFTRSEITRGRAELIVWPEYAVPPLTDPRFMEGLRSLALEQGAEIVFGALTPVSSDSAGVFTSAYHLSSSGEVLGRYDKRHRIPWARLVPVPASLGGATPYGAPVVPGAELRLFASAGDGHGLRFAPVIGSEMLTSGFAREASSSGADFIVNIASDGISGPSLYRHLLGHAILRAVENRIAVVRVANEGISGFIDPTGGVRLLRGRRASRRWLEEGTLVDRVPTLTEARRSPYSRQGDLFAYVCVVLSIGVLLAGWRRGATPSPRDRSDG